MERAEDDRRPHPAPLPRPFYDRPWPAATRSAARALWHWHLAVLNAEAVHAWQSIDVSGVEAGEHVGWLPEAVQADAHAACVRHNLSRSLLADQVGVAPRLWGRVRFSNAPDLDAVIAAWAGSHGRLLAALADAAHSWQVQYVREFARGLYLVGRLVELPNDARRDRIFIPMLDLEQADVDSERLRRGSVDEPLRRLLWKQVVRARDALAHGAPLVNDVSPSFARALRRWWMGGVEILNVVERRGYDVWSRPVVLSMLQRLQVRFQAQFGRTTFRTR